MSNERYYSFDSLRAFMMLLGLIFHSALSYVITMAPGWPFVDRNSDGLCDFIVHFIHVWRMPLFFLLGGFFFGLSIDLKGAIKTFRNRAARFGIPFVLGYLIICPIVHSGFVFASRLKKHGLTTAWEGVNHYFRFGVPLGYNNRLWYLYSNNTMHFWFLYYLIIFTIAALIVCILSAHISISFRLGMTKLFNKALKSKLNFFYFSIPTALLCTLTPTGKMKITQTFLPDLDALFGFFVFFCVGWLLYYSREFVPLFQNRILYYLSFAIFFSSTDYVVSRSFIDLADPIYMKWVAVCLRPLATWLYVFALLGLFKRYLDRPIPFVRYLSDASYWLYIVHLPFTIWLPGFLLNLNWPGLIKFSIVLTITTCFCLVSYEIFVKNSFVGLILNGRIPKVTSEKLNPIAPIGL